MFNIFQPTTLARMRFRGVFRTQSDIHDGAFFEKIANGV